MNSPETADAELMTQFAAGDQGAFAQLYMRYRGPLYRYFRRQLASQEADDCFQALWLKVIGHAPRYRTDGSFKGFVFTLAHNQLMDHYRKQRRTIVDDAGDAAVADLEDGGPTPEAAANAEQLRDRLYTLLARLPLHQREAWILKQDAAMTVADIAVITGTSPEGVRSRLRYASDKLKAGMARYV